MNANETPDRKRKTLGLRLHLAVNFYPAYPEVAVTLIVREFNRYWRTGCNRCEIEARVQKAWARVTGGACNFTLGSRFDGFLLDPEFEAEYTPDRTRSPWYFPAKRVFEVESSVKHVLDSRDIKFLTAAAYEFITAHMGFIAHYDLHGFRAHYADVAALARNLLTSEYSTVEGYNSGVPNRLFKHGTQAATAPEQAYYKKCAHVAAAILKLAARV